MKHQVRRILIVGQQNTGKSTFVLRNIISRANLPGGALVIQPDSLGEVWQSFNLISDITPDQLSSAKLKRAVYDASDKNYLLKIKSRVFNTLLIFDDSLAMLTDNVKYRHLENILSRARQTGNMIVFTLHALSSVPAPFWNYYTDLILFKTADEFSRAAYKIPHFSRISKAVELLREAKSDHSYIHINLMK